jgi:hypothetical protein
VAQPLRAGCHRSWPPDSRDTADIISHIHFFCLAACMERITPARRDPAVQIRLGPTNTGSEVTAASQRVVRRIGSGKITPSEGEEITSVLENRRKVIETAELDSRIANLEEAQGKNEVLRHSRCGPNGGRGCAPNGRPTIDRDLSATIRGPRRRGRTSFQLLF